MSSIMALVCVLAVIVAALFLFHGVASLCRGSTPAPQNPQITQPRKDADPVEKITVLPKRQIGVASWYGERYRGRRMANGAPFDPDKFTCACWDYPLGTRLLVNAEGDPARFALVVVTDRGPHHRFGRVIDLSAAAFDVIADRSEGLARVEIHQIQTEGKR